MTLEDLRKIHEIGNEILFDVVRICEKYDIQYYLMYGTLLGAVRHGGPIPWDDDVDLGMTRENYYKFLAVAEREIDPRNEIHIMGSGSTKYLSEVKIGRKGTRYYLPGTEKLKIMQQVQLDIFMIDYIKESAISNEKWLNKIKRFLEFTKLDWDEKRLIMKNIDKDSRHGKWFYKTGICLMHILRMVFKEVGIEKIIYKMYVDESQTSGKIGVISNVRRVRTWPAESGVVKLVYAGMEMTVPSCYKEILEEVYGNYMEFPPEGRRYRKHFNELILEID